MIEVKKHGKSKRTMMREEGGMEAQRWGGWAMGGDMPKPRQGTLLDYGPLVDLLRGRGKVLIFGRVTIGVGRAHLVFLVYEFGPVSEEDLYVV